MKLGANADKLLVAKYDSGWNPGLTGAKQPRSNSVIFVLMATTPAKPEIEVDDQPLEGAVAPWPGGTAAPSLASDSSVHRELLTHQDNPEAPSHRDALQALLAFSALHDQVRRRRALAVRPIEFDLGARAGEFAPEEQFVLDEVLQLVAERAIAITGADGLAIALAENNEIVLRASAGTVRPDVGTRIDRSSAFSGACFRSAEVVRCNDTELDARVNLRTCRKLGARSIVAVPLCGRRRVIGILEAFSVEPFGFNDSDVRNLTLLAELVLGALKPEDEDRFADSAQVAAKRLDAGPIAPAATKVVPAASEPAVTTPAPKAIPVEPAVTATPKAADVDSIRSLLTPKAEASSTAPAVRATPEPAQEAETSKDVLPADQSNVQPEPGSQAGVLVVLALIVVAVLVAGGVWWKLKTAQLGSAIVTGTPAENSSAAAPAKEEPEIVTPPVPAAPAEQAPAGTTSDDLTQGTEAAETPATPQELSKFPRITAIRHWSSADSSTVVLDLDDQVQYEAHRLSNPDRIYFDLHDTALGADVATKAIEVGDSLISRIRVAQPVAGMTRVVLETKGDTTFSVRLDPNPYRLVVEVQKPGAAPKGAVNLFPSATDNQKKSLAIVVPPPTRQDLQWRAQVPKLRIVVDAGHGGWDLGTVGRRGLLEKDLCLEIAQRLGKLLQSRLGAEVIYTRQDDTYIPLDERAEIANQAQADLFVSVHANYSDLPSARGVETYYTNSFSSSTAKDSDAHSLVANKSVPILSAVELHDRIEQSRRLAASVQRSLYASLSSENPGLRDRGVKEAGFVVLTETAMPGVLAEVSFVSSPTDEQKLRSDGYREQIAEALYRGIAHYALALHRNKLASAGE